MDEHGTRPVDDSWASLYGLLRAPLRNSFEDACLWGTPCTCPRALCFTPCALVPVKSGACKVVYWLQCIIYIQLVCIASQLGYRAAADGTHLSKLCPWTASGTRARSRPVGRPPGDWRTGALIDDVPVAVDSCLCFVTGCWWVSYQIGKQTLRARDLC